MDDILYFNELNSLERVVLESVPSESDDLEEDFRGDDYIVPNVKCVLGKNGSLAIWYASWEGNA
jgi:hypothetical protein